MCIRDSPDILAFGKKMQVCGILASKRVDEIKQNVFTTAYRINSTWGGNLVDMVRASKILEIIEEDKLVAKAASTGEYLHSRLRGIAEKYSVVSNVRAKGLIAAFDFPDKKTRDLFIKKGLEKNVMFLGCGNQSIRFRPALIMEKADLDLGLTVLEDVVKTL